MATFPRTARPAFNPMPGELTDKGRTTYRQLVDYLDEAGRGRNQLEREHLALRATRVAFCKLAGELEDEAIAKELGLSLRSVEVSISDLRKSRRMPERPPRPIPRELVRA